MTELDLLQEALKKIVCRMKSDINLTRFDFNSDLDYAVEELEMTPKAIESFIEYSISTYNDDSPMDRVDILNLKIECLCILRDAYIENKEKFSTDFCS